MKVKAILKGNEINFTQFVVLKTPEVEVEVDLPDDEVKIYTDEEIEKMSLDELAHLIWDNVEVDKEEINRDYRDILTDALMEKYK